MDGPAAAAAGGGAAPFSFPVLPDAALAADLATLGVPLPASGLAKPTSDGVQAACEALAVSLAGVTRCAAGGARGR